MSDPSSGPMIGLAFSGGGSRAMAFHLGCLRALHDMGVLQRVRVISSVSGGSVIGGLYAARDEPFEAFEARVRRHLAEGFVKPALGRVLTTREGLEMLALRPFLALLGSGLTAAEWGYRAAAWVLPRDRYGRRRALHLRSPIRRVASRTTVLQRTFDDALFDGLTLNSLPRLRPLLVVCAAELRTGSAFHFSRERSGSWRLGTVADSGTTLAQAVAASAAHPLFLPSLDERIVFDRRDGSRRAERVALADGGVYDNLALAPLWPDRDSQVSLPFPEVDTIICCRAGYGLRFDRPSLSLRARLGSTVDCIAGRAENAAVKRLFDLRESGRLRGFAMPFLGQADARLKYPPDDPVRREDTHGYPTDFSAMRTDWIDRLATRGEQLTRALLTEHLPYMGSMRKCGVGPLKNAAALSGIRCDPPDGDLGSAMRLMAPGRPLRCGSACSGARGGRRSAQGWPRRAA